MKWFKPEFINTRFGFEVTMYVYMKAEAKKLPVKQADLQVIYCKTSAEEETSHETA